MRSRRARIAIVVDNEDREDEGDLIMPAQGASAEQVACFLRHTSGVICAALTGDRLDGLGRPLMVQDNREAQGTAFTVSVDLAEGITTGISASDRARTLGALADRQFVATDFVRPDHIFPLRAREGGVLKRAGHTEAAVDLARLAGREPAGVLCEVGLDIVERVSLPPRATHENIAYLTAKRQRLGTCFPTSSRSPSPAPAGARREPQTSQPLSLGALRR